jgi:hypothetical protein
MVRVKARFDGASGDFVALASDFATDVSIHILSAQFHIRIVQPRLCKSKDGYSVVEAGRARHSVRAVRRTVLSRRARSDAPYLAGIRNPPCGSIIISTNSGGSWTRSSAPGGYWTGIASSADGTKLAALQLGGIYTSTNSGGTWTATSAPNLDWFAIAASADATKLAAVAQGVNGSGIHPIYLSADSGATWKKASTPVARSNEEILKCDPDNRC